MVIIRKNGHYWVKKGYYTNQCCGKELLWQKTTKGKGLCHTKDKLNIEIMMAKQVAHKNHKQ